MAFSIFPFLSTFTQYFTVNGPLYESADHGVFCGIGAMSTWSIGIEPSAGGGIFRFSSHSASVGHSNGFGSGAVGGTGVNAICTILGERIETSRSTRYAPQVSTGWPT